MPWHFGGPEVLTFGEFDALLLYEQEQRSAAEIAAWFRSLGG